MQLSGGLSQSKAAGEWRTGSALFLGPPHRDQCQLPLSLHKNSQTFGLDLFLVAHKPPHKFRVGFFIP